jgi:hypothetical protein
MSYGPWLTAPGGATCSAWLLTPALAARGKEPGFPTPSPWANAPQVLANNTALNAAEKIENFTICLLIKDMARTLTKSRCALTTRY